MTWRWLGPLAVSVLLTPAMPAGAAVPEEIVISGARHATVDMVVRRRAVIDLRQAVATTKGRYAGVLITRPQTLTVVAAGVVVHAWRSPGQEVSGPVTPPTDVELLPGRYRVLLFAETTAEVRFPARGLRGRLRLSATRRAAPAVTLTDLAAMSTTRGVGQANFPVAIGERTVVMSSVHWGGADLQANELHLCISRVRDNIGCTSGVKGTGGPFLTPGTLGPSWSRRYIGVIPTNKVTEGDYWADVGGVVVAGRTDVFQHLLVVTEI